MASDRVTSGLDVARAGSGSGLEQAAALPLPLWLVIPWSEGCPDEALVTRPPRRPGGRFGELLEFVSSGRPQFQLRWAARRHERGHFVREAEVLEDAPHLTRLLHRGDDPHAGSTGVTSQGVDSVHA